MNNNDDKATILACEKAYWRALQTGDGDTASNLSDDESIVVVDGEDVGVDTDDGLNAIGVDRRIGRRSGVEGVRHVVTIDFAGEDRAARQRARELGEGVVHLPQQRRLLSIR